MRSNVILGLLGLLLVGGCGGGETPGGTNGTAAVEDPNDRLSIVLATVNGMPVTAGDVRHHMLLASQREDIDGLMQNPDILQVALSALVDQFVWAEQARREGYTLTPGEERRVAALAAEFIATRYMADVVEAGARPSDEEVENWYREHQDQYLKPYRVAVRHLVVKTEAEAKRIKGLAENGADFTELVRQYSLDVDTRDIGGALGYVMRGSNLITVGRSSAFENAVLALEPGEVTVVNLGHGWSVAKVEAKEGGDLIPLEEVYQEISDGLLKEQFPRKYNEALVKARENCNTVIHADALAEFTGVRNNAGRIMELARNSEDPNGTIELYRRIAFDYADSPEAPEAQFMIAYVAITELSDRKLATKALSRLDQKFPQSKWVKAGRRLRGLLQSPEKIGTPEELLEPPASG